MSDTIVPLGDRLIVEREESEQTSAGGIVIPDSAKDKPCRGKVLGVGPGKRLDNGERSKPEVNVGDRVVFGQYAGTEVKVGNNTLVVLREDDVMGVLA